MILNCRDRWDWVPTMTKTRYNNDMTDRIDVVYAEDETKL